MDLEKISYNSSDVINRLKSLLGIKSDAELCRSLGIATTTYASMKQRNTLPYPEIISCCIQKGIDLNYIFVGNKEIDLSTAQVAEVLLERLKKELYKELGDLKQLSGKLEDLYERILTQDAIQKAKKKANGGKSAL